MLETGFSFRGLRGDVEIPRDMAPASPETIWNCALDMERAMTEFYKRAANVAESTMADVPREMKRIARKREKRQADMGEKLGIT